MKFSVHRSSFLIALVFYLPTAHLRASFRDDFDQPIARDSTGLKGWNFFTGDGTATMTFTAKDDELVSTPADKKQVAPHRLLSRNILRRIVGLADETTGAPKSYDCIGVGRIEGANFKWSFHHNR